MKYYRCAAFEDHPLWGGTTYIESDDGYTIREITEHAGEYFASNISHLSWGLVLGDQIVDFDSLETMSPISASEFDAIWQAYLRLHHNEWESVKKTYPIGTSVTGIISIFYPQGVIVKLGDGVLSVADYTACVASAPPNWIPGVGYKVTALVGGYDETNQWLILNEPHVHVELIYHFPNCNERAIDG